MHKLKPFIRSNAVIIGGLRDLLEYLRQKGFHIVLLTAGPIQVAEVIANFFQIDHFAGSIYGMNGNVFTGEILKHMGSSGKIESMYHFCDLFHCSPRNCIAVGDSFSDADLFKNVGCSIAINAIKSLECMATYAIRTENISDIIDFIFSEQRRMS